MQIKFTKKITVNIVKHTTKVCTLGRSGADSLVTLPLNFGDTEPLHVGVEMLEVPSRLSSTGYLLVLSTIGIGTAETELSRVSL